MRSYFAPLQFYFSSIFSEVFISILGRNQEVGVKGLKVPNRLEGQSGSCSCVAAAAKSARS